LARFLALFIVSFTTAFHVSGQEVHYYGANSRPVDRIDDAVVIKEVKQLSKKRYKISTRQKTEDVWGQESKEKIKILQDGTLRIYASGDRFFPKKIYRIIREAGPDLYEFEESTLKDKLRDGTSTKFLPLHLEGTITEYHPNGQTKSISQFHDNQLVSNQNWLSDGTPYIDSIFFSADKAPEFKPGNAFFRAYLLQQLKASKIDLNQIEDAVVIGWVVMETGKLEGSIALKGKSRSFNQFLVKTIAEMPGDWQPAQLNGAPVRYFISIPINISHREATFQDIELSSGMLHYNTY
jgi:hypothetical protein